MINYPWTLSSARTKNWINNRVVSGQFIFALSLFPASYSILAALHRVASKKVGPLPASAREEDRRLAKSEAGWVGVNPRPSLFIKQSTCITLYPFDSHIRVIFNSAPRQRITVISYRQTSTCDHQRFQKEQKRRKQQKKILPPGRQRVITILWKDTALASSAVLKELPPPLSLPWKPSFRARHYTFACAKLLTSISAAG